MNYTNNYNLLSSEPPIVGRGATIFDWNSKYAYEVLMVDQSGEEAILKRYIPLRIDEESPHSPHQRYEFRKLSPNHVRIKKIEGRWKIANRHTGKWDSIEIVFGLREEFNGLVA